MHGVALRELLLLFPAGVPRTSLWCHVACIGPCKCLSGAHPPGMAREGSPPWPWSFYIFHFFPLHNPCNFLIPGLFVHYYVDRPTFFWHTLHRLIARSLS
jgi:hypothetical protein